MNPAVEFLFDCCCVAPLYL